MAAPRASSLKALRNLQQSTRRSLHITGSNAAPSSFAGPDQRLVYLSKSISDLRAECQQRKLNTTGNKPELADRLSGHDMLQSRAFSIAVKKIDRTPFGAKSPAETTPTRHFNTSRALKSVRDSSTMDFAYLPAFDGTLDDGHTGIRVPILPDAYDIQSSKVPTLEPDGPISKPEIYSVTDTHADTHGPSAMSDVVDNHAIDIDPYGLTATVGKAAKKVSEQAGVEVGFVKQLWKGFLDDIFGGKGPRTA